jgi:putative ABC transport system substrate-binding protein
VRRLVILLAVLLAGAAMARIGVGQQVSGVPRVGLLMLGSPEQGGRGGAEFREGMRSLGWIEGSTIAIEDRFANGDPARLSANAADLAAAKVNVIVAFGPLPTQTARVDPYRWGYRGRRGRFGPRCQLGAAGR